MKTINWNGKTFTFKESALMEFFYPKSDTPFKGYTKSINAFTKGDIMTVIDIYIQNITGHPANDKQRTRIVNFLSK